MLELQSTPTSSMREPVVDSGAQFQSANLENACWSPGIEIQRLRAQGRLIEGRHRAVLGALNRGVSSGIPLAPGNQLDDCSHAVGLGEG
jgi:hypothetical protein